MPCIGAFKIYCVAIYERNNETYANLQNVMKRKLHLFGSHMPDARRMKTLESSIWNNEKN